MWLTEASLRLDQHAQQAADAGEHLFVGSVLA
jgi:hypothetical protein